MQRNFNDRTNVPHRSGRGSRAQCQHMDRQEMGRRRHSDRDQDRRSTSDPAQQHSYAAGDYVEFRLADEIVAIGSGRRRAVVTRVGRKWVSLFCPACGAHARVVRAVFDRLGARVLEPEADFNPRKLKRRIRRNRLARGTTHSNQQPVNNGETK
jgi:hypothetical protein